MLAVFASRIPLQVELIEYVKVGRQLYSLSGDVVKGGMVDLVPVRGVPSTPPQVSQLDPDQLCSLVLEVVPQGSCLVFCPTKRNCQNVAIMLCKCISR